MAVKEYVNGAWQNCKGIKRYTNNAWQNVSSVKAYKNNAWEKVYPTELNLYSYGDRCTSITGDYKIINLWTCYGNYASSSDRYCKMNSDNLEVRTSNWQKNGSYATNSGIDISNYSTLNILYDYYAHQSSTYNNGFEFGVSKGALTKYYDGSNPPNVICDGYSYKLLRGYETNADTDDTWFYNITSSLDISELTGTYWIFTAPFSWSWFGDYTIVKMKRIWLN